MYNRSARTMKSENVHNSKSISTVPKYSRWEIGPYSKHAIIPVETGYQQT